MQESLRCEFCQMLLLPHEYNSHACREMGQLPPPAQRLRNPNAGIGVSVIKYCQKSTNSENAPQEKPPENVENTPPEEIFQNVEDTPSEEIPQNEDNASHKVIFQYVKESCSNALEIIRSGIHQSYAEQSTSSLRGGITETRNTKWPHIKALLYKHTVYQPNLTTNPNKRACLEDRGSSSITSQTSNAARVISEEAGTFGSHLGAGICAAEPPESAKGERVVSKYGFQHLKESSFTSSTRMLSQMREYTTSSRHLAEASTRDTTRESVPITSARFVYRPNVSEKPIKTKSLGGQYEPSMGSSSLNAPVENLEQPATSGPNHGKERFAGGPPGSSLRSPLLLGLLGRKEQAATSDPNHGRERFAGGPPGGSQGSSILRGLLDRKERIVLNAPVGNLEQAATSDPKHGTKKASSLRSLIDGDNSQKFYCRLCKLHYHSWAILDLHIDRLLAAGVNNAMAHNHSPHYRKNGFFGCPVCQKRFDTKYDLDIHCTIHKVATPYKCLLCDVAYQIEKYLTKHEIKSHPKTIVYKCPKCYQRFLSEIYLANHKCDPLKIAKK